jgi:hypothetical protein
MQTKDIVHAIINGDYTNDELNQVAQAIKHTRHHQALTNKFTMRVGQNVQFNYKGSTHKGIVAKIKRIKISVKITESVNVNWIGNNCDVDANMLTMAE